MSEDKCSGDFFAGFVIGGLLGAALAIFLAPQSGKETQAYVRDKAIELREQSAEWSAEARRRADEMSVDMRKRAEEAAEKARAQSEELQARAQETLARGKEAATQQLDKVKGKAEQVEKSPAEEPAPEPDAA